MDGGARDVIYGNARQHKTNLQWVERPNNLYIVTQDFSN